MQFTGVNYALGAHSLFEKLEFSFSDAKIIGLVGMNGSGKSTLLKMMSGHCQPNSGTIAFQGKDLYKDRALQSQIGYVPSTPMLFPFLTVQENLQWLSTLRQVSHHAVTTIIRQFNLTGYQKILFGKLSDGLKKRICVACAFLHQPRLLILDEPCAGLDPAQRQFIWEQLNQYRHPSRLIIVSSHHPEELATFCDDIFLLSQSKLLRYPPSPSFAETLWGTIKKTLPSEKEITL